MTMLTTTQVHLSFDEENLLRILQNFCEALQTKGFEIKNSVIENTFSKHLQFNDFTEFKDTLQKSIAECKVRKSNDTFVLWFSNYETGVFKAIIKLHTKTNTSISEELLAILNNAILEAYSTVKPKNDPNINISVAEYNTNRTTLIIHEETQIIKPDKSLSDVKTQLTDPIMLVTKNIKPTVDELLDAGVYQEGEIISAKWLLDAFKYNADTWLRIMNHAGYYPNEEEVNEIFDILDVEAKLSYENLYEDFEEMMYSFKPGKELLLQILTRTAKEAVEHLEKIIQEER